MVWLLHLVDHAQPRRGILERLSAAQVVGARHSGREAPREHVEVRLRDFLDAVARRAALARVDDVRLERRSLHVDTVLEHGVVECALHLDVDGDGVLERVVSLEADIRLDDRAQSLALADERISREVEHICVDDELARLAVADVDVDGRSPLGEPRSCVVVLLAPRRKAVESLHDGVSVLSGQFVHLEVRLDAGHDTHCAERGWERLPIVVFLVECLRVEDDCGEVVRRARRE